MQPVRDEIAPGYSNTVYRPMDLTTIKKNIENGQIKSTKEFQRDIMLMFTNAIMYNSSNHDVHKISLEMYKEVLNDVEVRRDYLYYYSFFSLISQISKKNYFIYENSNYSTLRRY
jgi:hypothetical protein